ncbi:PepSY-associated TM region (PiuB) (PUBMED:15124630) [Commensalibacter communis]|uniref:PepSY-associated TM helix domain-containing protein n=1 Tax=Commensalibacter communis TaxID=2972786 RepID=UPI0022FF5DFF|nr:PepSY-associated TM helix domain-containing protein [Commensalibacter communis]CAI3947141.1 PepSY-associated TM region (PiuB) (PUBMED:15124630) [Commensalibacter communis]CAI3948478.1 PepSY-associated TM region (PiuB) (PUBMED:15124630) [Commensalibacter communis]
MNKNLFSFFRICHQWFGLIGGWLLFVLFVSGTISIYDKEITQWMQPELGMYAPTASVSSTALDQAYDSWKQHKQIRKNLIALPSSRDPFIRVLHAQDNMLQGNVIHPQNGNIIPVRATGGGYFIDSFHNNLFIGRFIGGAILLIMGIAFIFVIISGVVIYLPKIVKNAFFVYPKPQTARFKSDLHTISGFFFLPFLFIVAISGVLFLAPRYLPNTQPLPNAVPTKQHKEFSQQSTRLDLLTLLNKAQIYFNTMPGAILFTKKEVRFIEGDEKQIARLKNYVAFDKKTQQISSFSRKPTIITLVNQTLLGIHTVRSGGHFFRVIFAIMGIGSSVLIACGLLFYSNRKRNSLISMHSIPQQLFYRITEGITIGIIMGTLIAMITLLWSNRLLPAELSTRINWEINCFFISFFLVLGVSIMGSILGKIKCTWLNLTFIFSGLCLLLPFLNYIQTAPYFIAAIHNSNYLYLITDAVIFICGIIFLRLFFYIKSKGIH